MSKDNSEARSTGGIRGDWGVSATAIAWRNLWRNPRRTWLTAGGVAFACVLLLFSRSMQLGSYVAQIEATTELLSGHLQIQAPEYLDDPRLEHLLHDSEALAASILGHPSVTQVSQRAATFALLSVGERSFGVQVIGVEPERELEMSSLPAAIVKGRYLAAGNEIVMGALLAKNLNVGLESEIVILGSGPEGGVAALAVDIVGIFESGQAVLDRSLVQIPLQTFQDGFFLGNSASYIVINLQSVSDAEMVAPALSTLIPEGAVVRTWQELLPEVVQGISLDRISARIMYAIISGIVLFSIVNTFIMTLYERTRELGMLMAIGMKPWRVVGMLQIEAFWLAIIGGLIGVLLAVPLLVWLVLQGIPIDGMEEMMQGIVLPTHIRGAVLGIEFLLVPLVFVLGCQLAAIIPGRRILRIDPVEALRRE